MSGGSKFKLVYDAVSGDGDEVKAFMYVSGGIASSTTVGGAEYVNVNQRAIYAEDAAAVSGDIGMSALLVRQDTLAVSTSTDGDYGAFKSNNLGELYVFDTGTHSALSTANASLSSILSDLNALSHAEDAAHVSGDIGVLSLAVRNDGAATTLTSANGDYSGIAVDSKGRIFTETQFVAPQAMTHGSDLSTTTAALLIAGATDRREILIQNDGNKAIAVGGATVTYSAASPNVTDGIIIRAGGEEVLSVGEGAPIWTVAQSGSQKVRFMQIAG